MKFDAIIMNPPYNTTGKNTIGDNILFEMLTSNITNNLVTVQPINNFIKPWSPNETDKYITINDKCASVHLYRAKNIWPEINISTPVAVCSFSTSKYKNSINVIVESDLSFFNNTYKKDVKALNEICNPSYFGNAMYESIKNKIQIHNIQTLNDVAILRPKNDKSHVKNKDFNSYCVDVLHFSDSILTQKYMSPRKAIVRYRGKILCSENSAATRLYVPFSTINEVNNYKKYNETSYSRFIVSIAAYDKNMNYNNRILIPFLDYRNEITRKRFKDMFNISSDEMKFIEDFGKQLNGELPKDFDWSKYD